MLNPSVDFLTFIFLVHLSESVLTLLGRQNRAQFKCFVQVHTTIHLVELERVQWSVRFVPILELCSMEHLFKMLHVLIQSANCPFYRLAFVLHTCGNRYKELRKLFPRPFVLVIGMCGPVVAFFGCRFFGSTNRCFSLYPPQLIILDTRVHNATWEAKEHFGFYIISYRLLH